MEQVMLDMIPTGAKAVCHVSQYDIGRTIRFNLRSGGAAYTLAGTETVKVYIKKPDGTTAERNIANTSSIYVDWVTGEGDCDQAGNCECELVITSGTTVIGSKNFTVNIEEDPYNDQGVVTETGGPAVIATFTTNVVDLLQEVKCSINPIQNGTPWIDSNEVNKEPYIKRAVAGTASRIGNHLYDKLVGGTVAFNQLIQNGNFESASGWNNGYHAQNFSVSNNEGSFEATGQDAQITGNLIKVVANHIFLCHGFAKCTNNRKLAIGTTSIGYTYIDITNVYSELNALKKASASNSESVIITSSNSDVGDVFSIKKINIIDLTQKFGSTIADYIYSLEQATAGAGVAFFRTLFSNDYYAYNAGELMSVKATAHVMKNASNTVIGNYPLDSDLELRGIPKLVNNKLEYDGDEYTSDGNVLRKYGIVDLGSLTWIINHHAFYGDYFYTTIDFIKYVGAFGVTKYPLICPKYVTVERSGNTFINHCLCANGAVGTVAQIQIKDDNYSDAAAFKASLSGVYLVYEKVEATTEQASPFTNPQVCDENGTEEYTDNRAVAIPVGHETYQANICDITGFDELNIYRAGANLCFDAYGDKATSGTYLYPSDDNLPIIVNNNLRTAYAYVGKNADVVISFADVPQRSIAYGLEAYPALGVICHALTVTALSTKTFKVNSGAYDYIAFYYCNDLANIPSECQIELGNMASEYHAYDGEPVTVEIGQEVYGGQLIILPDRTYFHATHYGVEYDGTEDGWSWYGDYQQAAIALPYSAKFDIDNITYKCNRLTPVLNQSRPQNIGNYASLISSGANGAFSTPETSLANFKTWLGSNHIQFVYELATPFDIDLTPQQIEALLGVNNVWHDGNGDTEVKYLYNA